MFDSNEEDVSVELSEHCVPSARGCGSGQRPKPGRPNKPNTAGMSEQEALIALLQWQASWKSDKDRDRRRGHMMEEMVQLLLQRKMWWMR